MKNLDDVPFARWSARNLDGESGETGREARFRFCSGRLPPHGPRTVFGGLPIVFVTRNESCINLFLTSPCACARRLACPDQATLSTLLKGPRHPTFGDHSSECMQSVRMYVSCVGPIHSSRFRAPSLGPWLCTVEKPFLHLALWPTLCRRPSSSVFIPSNPFRSHLRTRPIHTCTHAAVNSDTSHVASSD